MVTAIQTWPISKYRDLICDTVANNLVTVTSGTGNKSIMVPVLYETGQYGRIYQTNRQIIATRENAGLQNQIRQFTGHVAMKY